MRSTVSETVEDSEVPANGGVRDSRATTCRGTRRDGEPCSSRIVRADGYCRVHSPALSSEALVEQTRQASARGVARRREQAKTVRDRLREKVEADFETLWSAFESGLVSDDERTRLASAVALLAEAYGRPPVAIVGDPDRPVSFVLDSLLARARGEQLLELEEGDG